MPTFRALLVAAVSSPEQATEDKVSIEDQLAVERDWCAGHDSEIVSEVVIPGHSRWYTFLDEITADCPEYAEMLRVIRSGKVNLMLAAYYPRLYRTMDLQAALMAECRRNGVQVYSPVEGGNLQPPDSFHVSAMDKLVESVHGFRAESEIDAIRQRQRVGMTGRIRAGYHPSNGGVPYGYRAINGHRQVVEVEPQSAEWVRWIYERRAEGWGYPTIANHLNALNVPSPKGKAWSYNTLRRILYKQFYIGEVHWGVVVNPEGRHDAIVPADLWHRVQTINRNRSGWKSENSYPLSGLCRCGYCGWSMGYGSSVRYRYIGCNRYKRYGKEGCQCNAHKAEVIEAQVFALVHDVGQNPALYWERQETRRLGGLTDEIAMIDRQIADMAQRYERLLDLVERGALDAAKFAERVIKLDAGALKARRAVLLREAETAATADNRLLRLAEVVGRMHTMTPDELRALYSQYVARITLWRERDPEIILL